MEEAVKEVVELLKEGGVILYPTDTVWGIGCDATNKDAVAKIYNIKRSENKTSMIVLCNSLDMVARYFRRPPAVAFDLIEVSDTPLTVIMPEGVGVAENLIPEEGTLAVRIPDHEFCKAVIRRLNRPLVSTSANISGEETPVKFADISKEILEGVDRVVNPRYEGKPTRKPSSIIKIESDGGVKIIR